MKIRSTLKIILSVVTLVLSFTSLFSQGTRLLRQPSLGSSAIVFAYAGDIWTADPGSSRVTRLTSTQAVESDPKLSPDGRLVAFTSNRSGIEAVYVVPSEGGEPMRLTWYPARAIVRGWTPDGKNVLYASPRENKPAGFDRLWTVPVKGGPSVLLSEQWGTDGSFSPDGKQIVIDRVSRWDVEWRHYRGGQNTPLEILNLADQSEKLLPYESAMDIHPVWLGDAIYFLSDRDRTENIWQYSPSDGSLKQVTHFTGPDIKWLSGYGKKLVFEREGYLNILDLAGGETKRLEFTVTGDFPWAETRWEDVTKSATAVSLSPTGKRILLEARGDIFTVPVENGDTRNLTSSSGAADHNPVWSPRGNEVAWFSDAGMKGYSLLIASQDAMSKPRAISIGESKMAWEPVWSPDGRYIAFDDNKLRIRIVDVAAGTIKTVDTGAVNIERGSMGLTWSNDSKWLAYSKTAPNNFRRIVLWSVADNSIHLLTNLFADSFSPAWDRDGHHLYFLATTSLALRSGWANTSSIEADPSYLPYIVNLRKDDPSPFVPRSDEETVADEKKTQQAGKPAVAVTVEKKIDKDTSSVKTKEAEKVIIDFTGIDRRTTAIPTLRGNYQVIACGPAGIVFLGEQKQGVNGLVIQKYTLEKREAKEYVSGADQLSVSNDGKKMLARVNGDWKVMNTTSATGNDGTNVRFSLRILLDREAEWKQIFEETWRYEHDYFYDPNMHGRNWNEVYDEYSVMVPFIKHRTDLTYILDQVNGELSVGHSFVFGGDFPEVGRQSVGLLGADLVPSGGRWKINRIYTTESWNPFLSGPLDRPGLNVREGYYLVGVNGKELTDSDDPYRFLDGTVDIQTTLHINKVPSFEGSWKEIVKPVGSEYSLRQRVWVEDNRRLVDSLSGGKLAYVWVPNTGGEGFISFNRYFFAQQDKKGAVIDERFNGGGLLDDYMVDLMNRRLRAALTNEVAGGGRPFRLPAGNLGPKVLLINELSGSGGDFFPWVFRQQKTGPIIGTRTWGGLVKSSVHYSLLDGGAVTAPDNAVFDPVNNKWVAENQGIPPDIEVRQDAPSLKKGRDPQLERAVIEALKLLENNPEIKVIPPPFSTPAKGKE